MRPKVCRLHAFGKRGKQGDAGKSAFKGIFSVDEGDYVVPRVPLQEPCLFVAHFFDEHALVFSFILPVEGFSFEQVELAELFAAFFDGALFNSVRESGGRRSSALRKREYVKIRKWQV